MKFRFTAPSEKEGVRDVLPRYCARSGHRLERITQQAKFDEATGQQQFVYWLACPDAEHLDSPYVPNYGGGSRARFVLCDLSGWAEKTSEYYSRFETYVDCTPWPRPVKIATAPKEKA